MYARVSELFESLILTVSGTSSHLHIWDPESQTFLLRNLQGKDQGHIVIVGKDEVVSARSVCGTRAECMLTRFVACCNAF